MKVVNVRGMKPNDPRVVYCGRRCAGWSASPLANPYHLPHNPTAEDREVCIAKFRAYLMERIEAGDRKILDALDALTRNSVLGCWCKPLPCHCDVIAESWAAREKSRIAN
jgi:hypothetical protein